jgi:hypothetical protein
MFLRYLDFIFRPFREMRAQVHQARSLKYQMQGEVRQVQQMRRDAKEGLQRARDVGKDGQPGAPGAAAAGGAASAPAIRKTGFWCFKKHWCTQCESRLEKSWDMCPYCAQPGEAPMPVGPGPRTRAIMVDAAGAGSQMQLLGWLVPLQGAQRGELYTLAPVSVVGTDPGCTVCLLDDYMSAHHAEIKAEAGVWILRDLGSTNGTYVNDKRVDQHELVDNDFVRFGKSLVKFKTL